MERKLNVYVCIAFALVIAVTLGIIFGNSIKGPEESKEQSDEVVEVVRPVIDPKEEMSESEISLLVRKTGHFVEYMALGIECACFAYYIYKKLNLTGAVCAALFCLLMADVDEFIQSFTGRGSAVADVLIDLGGAVVGITIGFAASYAVTRIVMSKKKKAE